MRTVGGFAVSYNVTIGRLKKYLTENGIELDRYPAASFDDFKSGNGVTLGLYGGVSESIIAHIPSLSYTKVCGLRQAYAFLDEYEIMVQNGLKLPALAEVYNCEDPCDGGPGCGKLSLMPNSSKKPINASPVQIDFNSNYCLSKKAFDEFSMQFDVTDFYADYAR